jgi:glycosyltransferase involved in cell wall biosynthesis
LHGNEVRLQRLILWLRRQGHRVILVVTAQHVPSEQQALIRTHVDRLEVGGPHHTLLQFNSRCQQLRRILRRIFSPFPRRVFTGQSGAMKNLADHLCPAYIGRLVQRITAEEPVDVFLAFYAFTLQAFEGQSRAIPLLCDTNEVFSMTRFDSTGNPLPAILSFSPEQECLMLQQADCVVAIQSLEAAYLRDLLPGRKILTVGIDSDLPQDPGLPSQAGQVVGILGSDNPANREGLALFLDHSWPLIKASCPKASLHIAGKLGLSLRDRLADSLPDGACVVGWIDDLQAFYRGLRLVVNPVIRGTGLKIKTVEALAHARPIVSFAVGLEGISPPQQLPWFEVADPRTMAERCIDLLQDPQLSDAMAHAAHSYSLENLSPDKVYAPLARLLFTFGNRSSTRW